jgi:diguanylate cyclase (GGDEF)-like protein/PAS domain S-box-containing protein
MAPWQCEFRCVFLDGTMRWLLGSAVPQAQSDGSVLWCGAVTDITSQKQALERLQESETRFRSLTQLSSDWYWEQDEHFRFVRVDGSEEIARGLPALEYAGKTRWESGALGVSEEAWSAHRAALLAHEVFHDFEMKRMRPDGRVMWVTISGAPVFDAEGVFKGYRGTGRDITARKAAEDEIERLAFYDPLTSLPNRRLLLDRLAQALEHSMRHSSHGALLFIDLDNFKVLNDTLGHHQGDELLKQVASRLVHCVRSIDTVARLGGDEFVVMLEDIGHAPADAAEQTEAVGKKILSSLNHEYVLGGQPHHSSPSIGVALFYQHSDTVDELLKRADLAMYQAKAAGRNTLRFYDPRMQAAANARAALETDMRKALDSDEFVLYYQPVVDEHSAVTGVEALVRWLHPERGMISPGEFIPVAEQTALILRLGQWVLASACQQLVRWQAHPSTERLTMAVNVSARQFRQPEFTAQVLELLRASGANPYRLKIELTESLLLNDMDDAIRKMSELRALGVGFALDDFGTGYSSLTYLKRLRVAHLKIDQSFVRNMLDDPDDHAILQGVIGLAASFNCEVIAEGVETVAHGTALLQLGCKFAQGYGIARPMRPDQIPGWAATWQPDAAWSKPTMSQSTHSSAEKWTEVQQSRFPIHAAQSSPFATSL